MRTGNVDRNEERFGVGEAGLYQFFILFVFYGLLEPTKESSISGKMLGSHRLRGNGIARTDGMSITLLSTRSNLSLSILLLCRDIKG